MMHTTAFNSYQDVVFLHALYDIGDSTTHHWALVTLKSGENLTNGPVQMFQVVTQRDGHVGYMASHSSRDLLGDESAQRLLCLVHLPELDTTMPDLGELMKAQPVGQGSTPLIEVPWGRWECSQWAIRAIKSLVDAGMVVPQTSKSFFTKAAASRAFWGPMLQVAGTKCAHEVLTRKAHNSSSGDASPSVDIKIMSLADSGILL